MAASAEDQHVSAEVARRPADEELEHVDHGKDLSWLQLYLSLAREDESYS